MTAQKLYEYLSVIEESKRNNLTVKLRVAGADQYEANAGKIEVLSYVDEDVLVIADGDF